MCNLLYSQNFSSFISFRFASSENFYGELTCAKNYLKEGSARRYAIVLSIKDNEHLPEFVFSFNCYGFPHFQTSSTIRRWTVMVEACLALLLPAATFSHIRC